MTFRYPLTLTPQTATTLQEVMERGHRKHFKTAPEDDAEHQQAVKCLHIVLYATTLERTTGEITIGARNSTSKVDVKLPPTAMVMIAEFDRSCIPSGAKDDDILGSMASTAGQIPGMHPIDQQMWYEVDRHKIHFLAAQGALDKDSGPIALASASAIVEGRLLMWMFMSDDLPMLNRLLNSTVQFGDHPPAPFAPFSLGDGPPVKLVP